MVSLRQIALDVSNVYKSWQHRPVDVKPRIAVGVVSSRPHCIAYNRVSSYVAKKDPLRQVHLVHPHITRILPLRRVNASRIAYCSSTKHRNERQGGQTLQDMWRDATSYRSGVPGHNFRREP